MWQNVNETYSRDAVRETLKIIMLQNINVSCPLSFTSLRENDNVKRSIVAYAKYNEGNHIQNFRFEIDNLESPVTRLIVKSDNKVIFTHEEKSFINCQ